MTQATHKSRREVVGYFAFGQRVEPSLSSRPYFASPLARHHLPSYPDRDLPHSRTKRYDRRRIWVTPQERPGYVDGRHQSHISHDSLKTVFQRTVLVIPSFCAIFVTNATISCASIHTLTHAPLLTGGCDHDAIQRQ